jgi:hypothetical protein
MDHLDLNYRTGKVVEAKIRQRFSSPVSFDPGLSPREFFLVLSFGRCRFRLSELLASQVLESIIGGHAPSFRVLQLADRVFRFSLHSQEVGFHIYKLCSFECLEFKIFFHLWHNGGANYRLEYRNWLTEQAKEWVEVVKGPSRSAPVHNSNVCLSGANLIPLANNCVHHPTKFCYERVHPVHHVQIHKHHDHFPIFNHSQSHNAPLNHGPNARFN